MLASQSRRALLLAYITVTYNILEGVIAVAAGLFTGSTALLGFGIDSFVESLSGGVMIWRFSGSASRSSEAIAHREEVATRLVAAALVVLGAYVAYESATQLYSGEMPDRSAIGIAIAVISLVVMPILYYAKRRTAELLNSKSLQADAKQTLACVLLSVALLVGVGLHYLLGWWQADPIAGLFIAVYVMREGYETWRHKEIVCC